MKPLERRLLRTVPAARHGAVITGALSAAHALLVLLQAFLLAHALADGFSGQAPGPGALALLAGVLLLRAGSSAFQEAVSAATAAAVRAQLRDDVLRGAVRQGPGWLSRQRTGELATLLGPGLDGLDGWFRDYLPHLVRSAVLPPLVLAVVLWADWRSGVVLLVALPLVPVFMALVGWHTRARTERQYRLLEQLGGHLLDVVRGLPTLQVFGRARAQEGVVRRLADEHRATSMGVLGTAFLSGLVLELLASLSVAVIAVSLGFRLLAGDVPLETAFLVLLLAPELFLPLRALGAGFHAAMGGLAAAASAFDVLDAPAPPRAPGGEAPQGTALRRMAPCRMTVRLRGATVRYDGRDAPALAPVDLDLGPLDRVVLQGPSGSGKSTLLGAVLGLVPLSGGDAEVGGVPLDRLDLDAWRRQVAWVPQRPAVVEGSVADNVRLGSPYATDTQVWRALEAAQLGELVASLPEGLATPLSERGDGLSVGELRRLALARAYLRGAPLLLLDEPTAGLDADSEARVVEALETVARGRTVLMATHRPGTVLSGSRTVLLGVPS